MRPEPSQQERPTALRAALVRSEIRRAYVVLCVVGLVAILVASQELLRSVDRRIPLFGGLAVAVIAVLQGAVLVVAHHALRTKRTFPEWFAFLTVWVEALVPTAVLWVQIRYRTIDPYAALSAPPILVYGLLTALTTLRLQPWLCVLAGGVTSGSYLALVLYVRYGLGARASADSLPAAAFISYIALIFLTGLVCAFLAKQIRTLFEAAEREAEMKREVERIEADIAVARAIQRALLPRTTPLMDGYSIAGWNRPADETGGDYYDWQERHDGRWLVSLADVSGHGVGPALVTAACRAYMRASSGFETELGALVGRVNRLLADDLTEGRFVTMANVLLDPHSGELELLSAGHGPIFLCVHGSGAVEEITPTDVPLAVAADVDFGPPRTLRLEPGDTLVLITDGFFEWAKPLPDGRREQWGLERLEQSLRRLVARPPADIIEGLAADVAAWADGEPQQDDLTVVVIQRARETP
ncbi:MAG: PP2C family protein-serine/threonine phosphatase [Phycisphaerae bacterium]|nr:PP2C family protein-serine/threonine phosphatase [Phycisphaerae bacterium]